RPDGWRVEWRYPDDCEVCGESCKRSLLPLGEIVYVGDGYSDRCAALASDRVFATSRLPHYLAGQGKPFEPSTDCDGLAESPPAYWRSSSFPCPTRSSSRPHATAPSGQTSRTSGTRTACIGSSADGRCESPRRPVASTSNRSTRASSPSCAS